MRKRLWRILTVAVLLAVSIIPLIQTSPVFASTDLNLQVNGSTDDARYYQSSSVWTYNANDVTLYCGSVNSANDTMGSGFVFDNVTIPQGSTINDAYFSVQANTSTGTAMQSKIYGQDSDTAVTFANEADFKNRWGVNGGTDLRTTANVDWNNQGAWSAGTWYNSPEIKTIIQEIVDRAGWVSGNGLALVWNDFISASADGNYRYVLSYDYGAANAPKLHITYTTVTVSVTTVAASNINIYDARLNGNLTGMGGYGTVDVSLQWDVDSGAPYANETTPQTKNGTGTFYFDISTLIPNKTYYFRARANYGAGSVYGAELNFTTDNLNIDYYGDSVTVGYNASNQAVTAWTPLVATATGYDRNNEGISGQRLTGLISSIYHNTVTADSISMALLAYNDMRFWGTNATELTAFDYALKSVLVKMAIPSADIIHADAGGVAYAGTWGVVAPYTGFNTKYSATAGSTATVTLTGSTIYIDAIQYGGSTCGLQVSVDSVNKGTFNNSSCPESPWLPYMIRISGLTNVAHTVVVTITAGTGYAYINWFAASNGTPTSAKVYVGGALRMANYASYAPYNQGSDSAVTQYASVIQSAVSTLQGDGLDIVYVPVNNYYVITTDIDADGVHPNDSGHDHIADAFLASMGSAGTVSGHTDDATAITTTTATLNGEVTDMGGEGTIECYFEYGTTVAYGSNTLASHDDLVGIGAFDVGITTLLSGTTYHFRAVLRYGVNYVYGGDKAFITDTIILPIGVPTNLVAIMPTDTSITLTWVKGGGSTNTLIKYSLAGYPTTTAEGTEFYSGALSTFTLGGFEAGVRVYISAWGESGGSYSTTYAYVAIGGGSLYLSVVNAQVFKDYLVDGDWLIVAECINTYPDYVGKSDVTRLFHVQLLDASGATIIGATTLKGWYDTPVGIYLSPTTVNPLTYGSGYIVRMIGTFTGTPSNSYTLQSRDWIGSDLSFLDKWVINTANKMSTYYGLTGADKLTVRTTGVGEILTAEGGAYFTDGIKGLDSIRPDIFQVITSTVKKTIGTPDNVYDDATTWDAMVGTKISGDATTFGALFGITGKDFLAMFFWLLIVVTVVFVFFNVNGAETPIVLILCVPILLIGNHLRIISIQWTVVGSVLAGLIFVLKFWWSRT